MAFSLMPCNACGKRWRLTMLYRSLNSCCELDDTVLQPGCPYRSKELKVVRRLADDFVWRVSSFASVELAQAGVGALV